MKTNTTCRLLSGNKTLEDDQDWLLSFECGETSYGIAKKDYLLSLFSHKSKEHA